jgi:hypothetical protein
MHGLCLRGLLGLQGQELYGEALVTLGTFLLRLDVEGECSRLTPTVMHGVPNIGEVLIQLLYRPQIRLLHILGGVPEKVGVRVLKELLQFRGPRRLILKGAAHGEESLLLPGEPYSLLASEHRDEGSWPQLHFI